jgi:hypothetical protein
MGCERRVRGHWLSHGTRYRISYGSAMNVYQFDPHGRTVARWCFAPEGNLCVGDILLAQKIALETMERQVIAIANSQDSMIWPRR